MTSERNVNQSHSSAEINVSIEFKKRVQWNQPRRSIQAKTLVTTV